MRALVFTVAFLLSAGSAAVAELRGLGRFEQLREAQFIAALYSENPAASAEQLLRGNEYQRMEIRIAKPRVSAKRFRQWWIDGAAINNSTRVLERHIEDFAYFTDLFDVQLLKGDQIIIERPRAGGVDFWLNDTRIGHVAAPQFFNLLLSGWIGEVSLSPRFRTALLNRSVDSGLRQQFDQLLPSAERVAAVAAVFAEAAAGDATAGEENTGGERERNDPKAAVVQAAPVIEQPLPQAITPAPAAALAAIAAPLPLARGPAAPEPEAEMEADSDSKAAVQRAEVALSAQRLLQRQKYVNDALIRTNKYSRYPRRALATRQQGQVLLNITLDRDGRLAEVTVVQESAHSLLNKAAVRAVRRASPFPPPPGGEEQFTMIVPISFKLVADLPN